MSNPYPDYSKGVFTKLEQEPMALEQERYTTDEMKVRQAVSKAVLQQSEQTPIGYLCENAVGHKYFRWKKPSSVYKPIALYAAPLQPEQEPMALETIYETIIQWDEGGGKRSRRELARRILSLYTTPPQRTWVDLTDEQMWNAYTGGSDIINLSYAKSILELFKEKNNG